MYTSKSGKMATTRPSYCSNLDSRPRNFSIFRFQENVVAPQRERERKVGGDPTSKACRRRYWSISLIGGQSLFHFCLASTGAAWDAGRPRPPGEGVVVVAVGKFEVCICITGITSVDTTDHETSLSCKIFLKQAYQAVSTNTRFTYTKMTRKLVFTVSCSSHDIFESTFHLNSPPKSWWWSRFFNSRGAWLIRHPSIHNQLTIPDAQSEISRHNRVLLLKLKPEILIGSPLCQCLFVISGSKER